MSEVNDLKASLQDALQLAIENLKVRHEGVTFVLKDDEVNEGILLLVPEKLDVDYDKYPAELDNYAVSPCQIKLSIKCSAKALNEVLKREKKIKADTAKKYTLLVADDDGEGVSEAVSSDDPQVIRDHIKNNSVPVHLCYVIDNRTGMVTDDFKW